MTAIVKRLDAKKNHEISTSLQYKPLYKINHSEKRVKNIQTAGYNLW